MLRSRPFTESLKSYFEQYGPIDSCSIMRDPTGRSRGFAFLVFVTKESVDRVVAVHPHVVDNKQVRAWLPPSFAPLSSHAQMHEADPLVNPFWPVDRPQARHPSPGAQEGGQDLHRRSSPFHDGRDVQGLLRRLRQRHRRPGHDGPRLGKVQGLRLHHFRRRDGLRQVPRARSRRDRGQAGQPLRALVPLSSLSSS